MQTAHILRKVISYGIYIIPLLALLVTNSMFFPFITGKNFIFRIIVLLLVGAWVVLMVNDKAARPKKNPITIAYASFIGIMILATIFSVAPHRSFWSNFERMDGLLNHLHLFALYLMASSLFTRVQWKKFFGVSIASSVAAMGYGVFQLAHVFTITQGGVRLESTLGNAIYFGGFLLFNLFIVGYWLREREVRFVAQSVLAGLILTAFPVIRFASGVPSFFEALSSRGTSFSFVITSLILALLAAGGFWALKGAYRERAAWGISLVAIVSYLFFIYKSGSRGILVGLFLGLLTTGILAARNTTGRVRRISNGVLAAGILLVVVVLGVGQSSLATPGSVVNRLKFESIAQTFETRTTLWRLGVRASLERPVLGWGPDTFIMAFNSHYDPALFSEEPWFDRAHNVFVDYLVHTGFLGFLAYLSLFGAAFYLIYKHESIKPLEKALLAGLLVAYIGQNITVFDNLMSYVFFFSFLAFLASWNNKEEEYGKIAPALPKGMSELIAVVMLILVVVGTYSLHIKGVLAAQGLLDALVGRQSINQRPDVARELATLASDDFKKVIGYNNTGLIETREQYVQFAGSIAGNTSVPEDLRLRIVGEALAEIQDETEREPLNARAPYFFGLLLRGVGQGEQAMLAFNEAQNRSPERQLFIIDRAVTLNDLGRQDEALALLEEARTFAERPFRGIEVMYALVAINANQLELLDTLLIPDVLLDDRVLGLLLQSGNTEAAKIAIRNELDAGQVYVEHYLKLAQVYLVEGDTESAIATLEEGIAALPESAGQLQEAINTVQSESN